jgi:hypothetical protein
MTDCFAHTYGIIDDTVIKNVVSQDVEVFAIATRYRPSSGHKYMSLEEAI